jgi:hypothetical protein
MKEDSGPAEIGTEKAGAMKTDRREKCLEVISRAENYLKENFPNCHKVVDIFTSME